jgi:competence protein ComEC
MIDCIIMPIYKIPLWKKAPFIRILLPFIIGIIIQYYTQNPIWVCGTLLFICLTSISINRLSTVRWKFFNFHSTGLHLNLLTVAAGGIITSIKNPFSSAQLIERLNASKCIFMATIDEPPAEKPSSWKALSVINKIQNINGTICPASNMLVYFRKDSMNSKPDYGNQIIFIKSLQRIENTASMKGFDYKRYCALKNLHYQVFLNPGDYILLKGKTTDVISSFIFSIRRWVVGTIRKNIRGKEECGLALALLIGYKDDLDRSLIQSYSNTGVVHVIAISGLHLGLIYAILKFLCLPIYKNKKWLAAIIIIVGLWIFTLLAGASPSILRSAVMFTCIVIGQSIEGRTSLINNLSASAFFLLCYNPYWLWDLGFILSYSALLSIVMFMKPVYHLILYKNKICDMIWQMNAVTISAQILTMPVIIYYFKQFPNLFLVTNFIAIPLSSIILIGEIIVCCIQHFTVMATFAGSVIAICIKWMNGSVRYIESIPFSTTYGLDINFIQLIIMYCFIVLLAGWLILHIKRMAGAALICCILFSVVQDLKFMAIHFN